VKDDAEFIATQIAESADTASSERSNEARAPVAAGVV